MKKNRYSKARDLSTLQQHLANERTFLAWIRTSIGIIVFGFIVEKFSLFLKQMGGYLDKWNLFKTDTSPVLQGYSSIFGIILVSLGALLCLLALIKFKHIERQIEQNSYHSIIVLDIMLALAICFIAILLAIILII